MVCSRNFPRPIINSSIVDKLFHEFLIEDEIIAPFNKLMSNVFANDEEFHKTFGVNFFDKNSYPRFDIIQDRNKINIFVDVPGISKDDINIELITQDDTDEILNKFQNLIKLQISSQRRELYDKSVVKIIHKELKCSQFFRSLYLDKTQIDTSSLVANQENGVLTITMYLKNVEEEKTKKTIQKIEISE